MGRELYFWSYVVAVLVFALGAGLSIYESINAWASVRFTEPRFDGAASILIGPVLAGVALLLARESKALLIG